VDERVEAERNAAAEELAPRLLRIFEAWRSSGRVLERADLAHQLACSDRILRVAVAVLRKDGHPIIAEGEGGYRFARSADEVLSFTGTLKSRIGELRQVVNALEAAAAREWPADLQMRLKL